MQAPISKRYRMTVATPYKCRAKLKRRYMLLLFLLILGLVVVLTVLITYIVVSVKSINKENKDLDKDSEDDK